MSLMTWQRYTLETSLDASEVRARLRRHTYLSDSAEMPPYPLSHHLFRGTVEQTRFRLTRCGGPGDSTPAASVHGTMESRPDCARLIIRCGLAPSWGFMVVLTSLFAVCLLGTTAGYAFREGIDPGWWGMLLGGLAAASVTPVVIAGQHVQARRLRNQLTALVQPDQPGSAPP
jgi:hypothetical protein